MLDRLEQIQNEEIKIYLKDKGIIEDVYTEIGIIFKNISQDTLFNEKGFPNKLNDLSNSDIETIQKWIDYAYITEKTLFAIRNNFINYEYTNDEFIRYRAFYILQIALKTFLEEYSNIKKRGGLFMKTRAIIPQCYI